MFLKYRIKHIRDEYTSKKVWDLYTDYDKDNLSEKISLDLNDVEQTKIIFRKDNRILTSMTLKTNQLKLVPCIPGIIIKMGIRNTMFIQ